MSALAALLGNVYNAGVAVELGGGLNFASGLQAVYNTNTKRIDVTATGGGGGSGGHTIEDEGTPLTARGTLNFVGVNVSVSDAGGKTVVTITGPSTAYVDAGDAATLAAAASLIPVAGGAPGAINLTGVAASAGSDPDFARQDHGHSISGRLPFANFVAATAGDKLVGSTAAGSFSELSLTGGVERSGSNIQISSQLPARGTENVVVDVYPSTQSQGTLATAASVTFDIPIAAGKRVTTTWDVWVDDGAGGACLYAKAITTKYHQTGGAAVEISEVTISAPLEGAGFTFAVAPSTTNARGTLSNTSGSTRSYNIAIGSWSMDKP